MHPTAGGEEAMAVANLPFIMRVLLAPAASDQIKAELPPALRSQAVLPGALPSTLPSLPVPFPSHS
jgi:hypothetical protein